MIGFGDIERQAAEKWRADVLRQLYRIRELLEADARQRITAEPINIEIKPLDLDCNVAGYHIIVKQLEKDEEV